MTFEELKKLSVEDITLILQDQADLYSEEELAELKEWQQILSGNRNTHRSNAKPLTIKCPKCDGPNHSANTRCVYCDYTFHKWDYEQEYTVAPHQIETRSTDGARHSFPIIRTLLGITLSGGGIWSIVYGCDLNNSYLEQFEHFWNHGSRDPGTAWIVMGVFATIMGLALLGSALFSRD